MNGKIALAIFGGFFAFTGAGLITLMEYGESKSAKAAEMHHVAKEDLLKYKKKPKKEPQEKYKCTLTTCGMEEVIDSNGKKNWVMRQKHKHMQRTGQKNCLLMISSSKTSKETYVLSSQPFTDQPPKKILFNYAGNSTLAFIVAFENGKLSKPCSEVYEVYNKNEKIYKPRRALAQQKPEQKEQPAKKPKKKQPAKKPKKKPKRPVQKTKQLKKNLEGFVMDECEIREVQHSSVSLAWDKDTSLHHGFVYVLCVNPEKTLTLVYPSSRMIRRGFVDVEYELLEDEKISSEDFVRRFVQIKYPVKDKEHIIKFSNNELFVDYFIIHADGIIKGLKYK